MYSYIFYFLGYSILVVVLAIICRMVITPFIMFGANLNVKEKIFVSLAWLPKATVQVSKQPKL